MVNVHRIFVKPNRTNVSPENALKMKIKYGISKSCKFAILVVISRRCFLLAMIYLTTDKVTSQNTLENTSSNLYELLTSRPLRTSTCPNQQQCPRYSFRIKPCHCDEYCHIFKDCCYDSYRKTIGTTNTTVSGKNIYCYDTAESKTEADVYMISDCPDDYEDHYTRLKCKHHEDLSALEKNPVSSNMTYLTYRNKFCALCNGVEKEEVDVWKIQFDCETFYKTRNVSFTTLIQSFMDDDGCDFIYYPSDYRYFRKCLPKQSPLFYQSCSDSYSGPLTELCQGYLSNIAVFVNNDLFRTYRNIHCLQCDTKVITIPDTAVLDVNCDKRVIQQRQRLIVTLDFHKFLFGSHHQRNEKDCSEKDIKIDTIGQCVALFCPDNQVPYFGDCVTDTVIDSRALAFDVLLVVNNTVEQSLLQKEVRSLLNKMAKDCFGRFAFIANLNSFDIFTGENLTSKGKCYYVKIYFEIKWLFAFDLATVQDCPGSFLEDLSYTVSTDTVITYTEEVQEDICFTNQTLEPSNFVVYTNSLTQSQAGVTCPSIEVQTYPVVVPEFPNQKETDLIKDDIQKDVYKIGSTEIDGDDVNVTDHGYFICTDILKSKYNVSAAFVNGSSPAFVDYGLIISYTGFSLSVVSMIVTLVHYICIPNMATLHSSVLVHLLSLTLVTHIVYVTTYFDILCWWAAILLHYLFLVMFFTMSLTLLHVAITSQKIKNPSYKLNKIKMITRFILPGYILPLMIVVPTVTVNLLLYKDKDWYGAGTNLCFLSDAMVLFLAFAIPILVCLVCNIVLFLVTCKKLCSPEVSNDHINTYRNRFWILLKLSSLVGFSWILGFIGALTDNQVVVYAFEATSSLQGVFLSFSLLYNYKVKQWYRTCISSTTTNTEIAG